MHNWQDAQLASGMPCGLNGLHSVLAGWQSGQLCSLWLPNSGQQKPHAAARYVCSRFRFQMRRARRSGTPPGLVLPRRGFWWACRGRALGRLVFVIPLLCPFVCGVACACAGARAGAGWMGLSTARIVSACAFVIMISALALATSAIVGPGCPTPERMCDSAAPGGPLCHLASCFCDGSPCTCMAMATRNARGRGPAPAVRGALATHDHDQCPIAVGRPRAGATGGWHGREGVFLIALPPK